MYADKEIVELIQPVIEKIKSVNDKETVALCDLDILLLTAEKTGSCSIFNWFNLNNINTTHIHSYDHFLHIGLQDKNFSEYCRENKINFYEIIRYNNIVNKKRPTIITIYREPIYRMLSVYLTWIWFCQNNKCQRSQQILASGFPLSDEDFANDFFRVSCPCRRIRGEDKNLVKDVPFTEFEIIEELNKNYKFLLGSDTIRNTSFLSNIIDKKNLNNYQNNNLLHLIYENYEILTFTMENINKNEYYFKNMFKIKNNITKDNTSKDRDIELYKSFYKIIKVQPNIIEKLYNDEKELIEFYYSNDEINVIKQNYEKLI